jgi:hypothetical protein
MLRKRLKKQIPTATPVAANSGYTCADAKEGDKLDIRRASEG